MPNALTDYQHSRYFVSYGSFDAILSFFSGQDSLKTTSKEVHLITSDHLHVLNIL